MSGREQAVDRCPPNRKKVGALARFCRSVPPDVLGIRWTPCSGVVSSCGVLNLDHLSTSAIRISTAIEHDHEGGYPTQGLPGFACSKAEAISGFAYEILDYTQLTPAKTLVMSSTRTPARGKAPSAAGGLARPLHCPCHVRLHAALVPSSHRPVRGSGMVTGDCFSLLKELTT